MSVVSTRSAIDGILEVDDPLVDQVGEVEHAAVGRQAAGQRRAEHRAAELRDRRSPTRVRKLRTSMARNWSASDVEVEDRAREVLEPHRAADREPAAAAGEQHVVEPHRVALEDRAALDAAEAHAEPGNDHAAAARLSIAPASRGAAQVPLDLHVRLEGPADAVDRRRDAPRAGRGRRCRVCARTESGPSICRCSTPRERQVERQVAPRPAAGSRRCARGRGWRRAGAIGVVEHALDERRLEVAEARRRPAGRCRGRSAPRPCRRPAGRARPRRATPACRAAAGRRRRAGRARASWSWRSPGALPGIRPAAWSALEPSSDAQAAAGVTDGAESPSAITTGASSRYCRAREAARAACRSGAGAMPPSLRTTRRPRRTGRRRPGWCRRSSRASRRTRRHGAAGPVEDPLLDPDRVGRPPRAVRRGRRPPSQLTCPVIRGERIRCHSKPSHRERRRPPAASRGCPPGPRAPSARPLSGRGFGGGIALSAGSSRAAASRSRSGCRPRGRTRMRPVVRRAPSPACRAPAARAPCHSA